MISTIDNLKHTVHSDTSTHLEDLIGNTPMLRLDAAAAAESLLGRSLSPGVSLLAKAEWYNPGGSIKDRAALNIIRAAERHGDLRPGVTLLESDNVLRRQTGQSARAQSDPSILTTSTAPRHR